MRRRAVLRSFLVVSLSLLAASVADRRGAIREAVRPRLAHGLGRLPFYFIENGGQTDPRVAYYVQGRTTSLYFTERGVTFSLTNRHVQSIRPVSLDLERRSEIEADGRLERWAVNLDFIGARPGVRPDGLDRTPAVVSYFKGPRAEWRTGLPTYGSIVYSAVWPGIDVIYAGTEGRLKSSFIIRPGADPGRVRFAYRGATAVELSREGELQVTTPAGGFREERPYAYQEVDGRRVEVAASYVLDPASEGEQAYGFRLAAYDRTRPLVLDPTLLVYAGYIGGAGSDGANGIAVDSSGNAYVVGATESTEATFPVTGGPDLTYNGGFGAFAEHGDVFVTKVNAAGTALVYAGYIGGAGSDVPAGIAVDGSGNAYVTGYTDSTETTFPVTGGPDLTYNGGRDDAFVAKVNAAGTDLVYAGYIGGAGPDYGAAIAVDASGNAYVAGSTRSSEATFPVKVGPDLTYHGGFSDPPGGDAFVAKVNPAGTELVYAGYIGGRASDGASGIAVDGSGNAYVVGNTGPYGDLPVTGGPDLTFNGFVDAFIAKVNAEGTALVYAGYIGGSDPDSATGVAVDAAGNAYVVGSTVVYTQADFPVTVGPDLTYNGSYDGFVAKVSSDGSALVYAGYIGGSGEDFPNGVAVDGAGNAYVVGSTTSTEASFPVTGGPDLSFNGGGDDAFVAKVNADGTALVYAGYIGGSGNDAGYAIAVDRAGNAYVAGATDSSEVTFPVRTGPDVTYNGGGDAFVAKVGSGTDGALDLVVHGRTRSAARGGENKKVVVKLCNVGITNIALDPAADIAIGITVQGNPAGGTFTVLNPSTTTLKPRRCTRYRIRWDYGTNPPQEPGDVVVYTATWTLPDDDPADNTDRETQTAS